VVVLLSSPVGAEVEWAEMSYEDAIKTAKSQNKYVLIDFYTTWCGPCKQMDKDTYADPTVAAFLGEMIPVKWDSEKGEGIEVTKKYRVSSWPTTLLIGPDGEEIDRHIGYLNAADFLETMKNYKNGLYTVDYYNEVVTKEPDNREAWKILGMKQADARRNEKALKALNRFVELTPELAGDEKAEVSYTLASIHYEAKSYEEAAELYVVVTQEFPESEWRDVATTRLARCYYKMGKTDRSIETYMSYVDRHSDDPKALNGFAWFCAQRKIGFDEALPVALRAAELSGRDPGILDTLAELYYAMGEYDHAIEIGAEALEKEPGDQYFTDQLEKFKKAKEEADGQARK
jgi:tetratricopeptide (TPR) repeat protein